MELDTRTTIVASFIVAALLAGTAILFARATPTARGSDPLRLWGFGLGLLALGYAGVATRGVWPDFVAIVVSNTLIVAALVVSYRALRAFRGEPPADALGWGLVAGVFIALWLLLEVWPDMQARIITLSVVRAFLLARN